MAELVIFTGNRMTGKTTAATAWRKEDPVGRVVIDEVESYGMSEASIHLRAGYDVGIVIALPAGTHVTHVPITKEQHGG